ncbi:MAG: polyisoprenoid-binding protein YceI [Polaribacter sp.]|jgi:polyisoprenoid-binding protein YceI
MKKTILVVALFHLFFFVSAQEKSATFKMKLPSKVIIKGTSTLHDWESIVEKTDAQLTTNSINNEKIETLNVKVEVLSIKSGKNLMDKLTYKALKAEEYPNITFIFKKGEIIKVDSEYVDIELIGDLTIAGVTKSVAVKTKINKQGRPIILKGSHKLKMTNFNIDPPKALLGTIKTGDEITIEFNLTFK